MSWCASFQKELVAGGVYSGLERVLFGTELEGGPITDCQKLHSLFSFIKHHSNKQYARRCNPPGLLT